MGLGSFFRRLFGWDTGSSATPVTDPEDGARPARIDADWLIKEVAAQPSDSPLATLLPVSQTTRAGALPAQPFPVTTAETPPSSPPPTVSRPWPSRTLESPRPVQQLAVAREVVLDVETTGLSSRAGHRIVSISMIEVIAAREIGRRLDLMVDPNRTIPREATAVHGIRDADVRRIAPLFAAVAPQISEFLGDSRIVGYNAAFDLDFLAAEFEASGITAPPAIKRSALDVMALFTRARPGPNRKLHAACDELRLKVPGLQAHSARDDATATALLYIALHSQCGARWNVLVREAEVALIDYRERDRYFDDDDLQAAWELFEARDYEAALARALTAVARDETRPVDLRPDPQPYEIACMILRRRSRLEEELDLLGRYFRRRLGPNVTPDKIRALTPTSLEAGTTPALRSMDDLFAQPSPGRRPRPGVSELAARFARATERLEPKPENNRNSEDRLARALARLPAEAAYQDAAICIRAAIANLVRAGNDAQTELAHLHRLAQQHAFLYGTYSFGWDHPTNVADAKVWLYPHVVAQLTSPDDLEHVLMPYDEVGYLHLPLLKKTDVKRLIGTFGEPRMHAIPRDQHIKIWEGYRRSSRQADTRWHLSARLR